jgi:hypothetical protein
VVIENRPVPAAISRPVVAKSTPDGTTWLLGNNSILATNQSLYAARVRSGKGFRSGRAGGDQPNILVVNPGVKAVSRN